MLQFSRRTILKILITATFVLAQAKMNLAGLMNVLPQEEQKQLQENPTLRALLETLIPADETPSALETGVLEKIINKARANPKYKMMLRKRCQWLDMKAREKGGSSFAKLTESDRDSVLAQAASENKNTPEYLFFAFMRHEAFYYYYAEPAIWKTLNYPGPPQPRGFRDYTQPPKRKPQ